MIIKINNKIITTEMICYISATTKKNPFRDNLYEVYGNIHMLNTDIITMKIGSINVNKSENKDSELEYISQQEKNILDKFFETIYNKENIKVLNYKN